MAKQKTKIPERNKPGIEDDLKFVGKVIRNAFILSGIFFVSTFASNKQITFEVCKPIIIFFLGYTFTELARFYGIKNPRNHLPGKKGSLSIGTLVFN